MNYLDASILEKINNMPNSPRTNDDEELVVKRLSDADFRKLVQSLNVEQK